MYLESEVGSARVCGPAIGFNSEVHLRAASSHSCLRVLVVSGLTVVLSACGASDEIAGPTVSAVSPTIGLSGLPEPLGGATDPPNPPTTPAPLTTTQASGPTTSTEPAKPIGDRVLGNRLLMIGDSLLASTAERFGGQMCDVLGEQGWSVAVEAEENQRIGFGDEVLDERLEKSDAPEWDAAAIFLGNNFGGDVDAFTEDLIDYIERLAPRPTLVYTLTEVDDGQAELNEMIRALPRTHPEVFVVDWAQLAVESPELLASDGLHLSDAGRNHLAVTTAQALGEAPAADDVVCLKALFTDDSAADSSGA